MTPLPFGLTRLLHEASVRVLIAIVARPSMAVLRGLLPSQPFVDRGSCHSDGRRRYVLSPITRSRPDRACGVMPR